MMEFSFENRKCQKSNDEIEFWKPKNAKTNGEIDFWRSKNAKNSPWNWKMQKPTMELSFENQKCKKLMMKLKSKIPTTHHEIEFWNLSLENQKGQKPMMKLGLEMKNAEKTMTKFSFEVQKLVQKFSGMVSAARGPKNQPMLKTHDKINF